MERRRTGREGHGARRDRYSSISLDLLLQYRTVLSRRTDPSGTTSWTAKVVGMPWCEASGATRTEALQRVREMAASRGTSARLARSAAPGRKGAPEPDAPAPIAADRAADSEGTQSLDA